MATSETEYATWAQRHGRLFGFTEADIATLMNWFEILACYNPEYLDEASNRLARQEYPSFARDHLKAILPILRELEGRRLQEQARVTRTDDRGTCVKCGETGWICDLPNLRDLSGQEWRGRYTMAVCCPCQKGMAIITGWKDEKGRPRPITWEQYEAANPLWFVQQSLYKQRKQAEAQALRDAEPKSDKELQIGSALDAVLERLKAKLARKGSNEQDETRSPF